MTDSRVIVALDFSNSGDAMQMLAKLDEESSLEKKNCKVKIGKELFTKAGPNLVKGIKDLGYDIFLDLKYHDIPNTVSHACNVAADLGVWMINLHALGGRRMMEDTMNLLQKRQVRPMITAVTILTSMEQQDLSEIGLIGTPKELVVRLAELADDSGVDGVVCSALETQFIRNESECRDDFIIVNPGIRFADGELNDQKRVTTPGQAIHYGADYLVIGRPITQTEIPASALARANTEIELALSNMAIAKSFMKGENN